MTPFRVWRGSVTRVPWLLYMWAMTHSRLLCCAIAGVCVSCVWVSCSCMTSFIYVSICGMTWHSCHIYKWLMLYEWVVNMWVMTHSRCCEAAFCDGPMASVSVSHMCVHVTWPHTHVTCMSHISTTHVTWMSQSHVSQWSVSHESFMLPSCTAQLPFHRCLSSMSLYMSRDSFIVCLPVQPYTHTCTQTYMHKHTRICHTHVQRAYNIRLQTYTHRTIHARVYIVVGVQG